MRDKSEIKSRIKELEAETTTDKAPSPRTRGELYDLKGEVQLHARVNALRESLELPREEIQEQLVWASGGTTADLQGDITSAKMDGQKKAYRYVLDIAEDRSICIYCGTPRPLNKEDDDWPYTDACRECSNKEGIGSGPPEEAWHERE